MEDFKGELKMRKERLTLEELQALPKDAFPITVECDDHEFTRYLKKITPKYQRSSTTSGLAVTKNQIL